MKRRLIHKALMMLGALSFSGAGLAADWFPLEVNVTDAQGKTEVVQYSGVDKADKAWKICAAYPHLKDSFWMAANYGMVEEAKRLGVQLQVMDAGGYPNLNNQISQIENCVAGGADAVILGAVSRDGLNNLLGELKKKNVPVIDVFNGVSSEDVAAHVLASPYTEGYNAGQYLVERHPEGSGPARVAWLPGPAGAGFVELFNKGFQEGVKGGAIEIVETKYGDLGREVQARLIEDVLQTHKDLDYIAGSAVTAEAGVPVLRSRNLMGDIKLIALYMTPAVYQGIKQKHIEAAYLEPGVNIARMAMSQAVKVLQGKEVERVIVPVGQFYDQSNINELDVNTAFAPQSFRPVFRVE